MDRNSVPFDFSVSIWFIYYQQAGTDSEEGERLFGEEATGVKNIERGVVIIVFQQGTFF